MPLEIEIKLKVDSHDPIRAALRDLHAQHIGQVRETNIFFDRPDGSLRRADSGLRVRLTTSAEDPAPRALLTFKGPAAAAGLHSREAFDLETTPHDQLIPLVEALGFQQLFLFEKDRDSWLLDNCHIEFDTLPHFGTFLEIEGPGESLVRTVQQKLGLALLPQQKQSYSHIVSDFLKHNPERNMELRF